MADNKEGQWVIEFPDGSTATLGSRGWEAEDRILEDHLNKSYEPKLGYRYHPDIYMRAANEAAENLGGTVIKEPKKKERPAPDLYETPRID